MLGSPQASGFLTMVAFTALNGIKSVVSEAFIFGRVARATSVSLYQESVAAVLFYCRRLLLPLPSISVTSRHHPFGDDELKIMKSFSLFCNLLFKFSSQLLKLGRSPMVLVNTRASHLVINTAFECSRHLVHSSKSSILLHRTAGRLFSCKHSLTLRGAKMMFLCSEWCFFNSLHYCFLFSIFVRKQKEKNSEVLYLKCAILSPH